MGNKRTRVTKGKRSSGLRRATGTECRKAASRAEAPDHQARKTIARESRRIPLHRAENAEQSAAGTSGRRGLPTDGKPEPLLTLRAAVILMAALLVSGMTGILTYFASASLPEAYLAAGPACVAVITLLNAIIGLRGAGPGEAQGNGLRQGTP
jgi:hypothetical protein